MAPLAEAMYADLALAKPFAMTAFLNLSIDLLVGFISFFSSLNCPFLHLYLKERCSSPVSPSDYLDGFIAFIDFFDTALAHLLCQSLTGRFSRKD
jgi:hypothetical protein